MEGVLMHKPVGVRATWWAVFENSLNQLLLIAYLHIVYKCILNSSVANAQTVTRTRSHAPNKQTNTVHLHTQSHTETHTA